eukprot:c25077_g4_i1 orf=3-206(-)
MTNLLVSSVFAPHCNDTGGPNAWLGNESSCVISRLRPVHITTWSTSFRKILALSPQLCSIVDPYAGCR